MRDFKGKIFLKYLFHVLFVSFVFILILYGFGLLTRPKLSDEVVKYSEDELLKVKNLRNIEFDVNKPLRIQQDVDYSEGKDGAWYPKGESSIIKGLVEEGLLPSVAERVGPEPCVMKGVDGIGKYGGTWLRLNDMNLGSRMTYTTLVRFSPQGFPIVPHLAKGWEVSEDSRVWTFFLRKGVKWSDGHPFTSDDIRYYWDNEIMCEDLYGSSIPELYTINGKACELITYDDNPYKITFSFSEPKGNFLALLATFHGSFIVNSPSHYLKKYHPFVGDKDIIESSMSAAKSVSRRSLYWYMKATTNPYHPRLWPWIYRSYQANPPETAARNPYYWAVDEKGNQLPYIEQLMREDVSVNMVPLRASAGGVSFQSRYIGYENYTYLMSQMEDGGYKLYHWYAGDRTWFGIQFNLNRRVDGDQSLQNKRDLMNDKRFRQAMSLSINRPVIIKAIYNDQVEAAQVAPGRESPFFNEKAYKAFTDYDPERASKLFDELGLNKLDSEGYRLNADGTRLTFYFDYTVGLVSDRPVQFVVDDWNEAGIRVVPRERQRNLWDVERIGLQHDINVWIGNGEHYPIIQPRCFAPVRDCYFAQANVKWYMKGGMIGSEESKGSGIEALSPDSPLYKALEYYQYACETSDLDEQVKRFQPILDIAAENVWTISICNTPPVLCVVQNGMRNIPETAVYSWDFQSPGNAGIETYYMERSNNSLGAVENIRNQIVDAGPRPGDIIAATTNAISGDIKAAHTGSSIGGSAISKVIRFLVIGSLLLVLILVVFHHPYIGRRLVIMVPTLAIISLIVFTVIQLPPGDYLTSRIIQLKESGDDVNMQQIKEIEDQFYLNDPMSKRYFRWMGVTWFTSFKNEDKGLLQGNLGRSMATGKEVNEVIGDRLLMTFLISLGTIIFTWVFAIPIGVYSAVKQYSIGDYILTFIGFIGMCIPSFLLALLLIYFSTEFFGISITGLLSPEFSLQPEWDWPKVKDLLSHIWLPIFVLGVTGTAGMIRVMRANLLDELKKPYVVTARAKGVKPMKLLMKYPVRLALNPFISGIGGIFPQLISGGAIVAVVLSLPTVGPLMLEALMNEDMYLAGSMLMILSMLGIFGTLVSDILLLILDPRIRLEGGSK